MNHLELLPNEILAYTTRFLEPNEIIRFGRTCTKYHQFVERIEFWQPIVLEKCPFLKEKKITFNDFPTNLTVMIFKTLCIQEKMKNLFRSDFPFEKRFSEIPSSLIEERKQALMSQLDEVTRQLKTLSLALDKPQESLKQNEQAVKNINHEMICKLIHNAPHIRELVLEKLDQTQKDWRFRFNNLVITHYSKHIDSLLKVHTNYADRNMFVQLAFIHNYHQMALSDVLIEINPKLPSVFSCIYDCAKTWENYGDLKTKYENFIRQEKDLNEKLNLQFQFTYNLKKTFEISKTQLRSDKSLFIKPTRGKGKFLNER